MGSRSYTGRFFQKESPLAAGGKLIFLKNNKFTVLKYGGSEKNEFKGILLE
jgi:hypothetical protein